MPERLAPDPRNIDPLIGVNLVGFEKAGLYFDTRTGAFSFRDKTGAATSVGSGGGISGTFPQSASGIPAYAKISTTRTPGVIHMVGGATGNTVKFYELTNAQYLANNSSDAAMVAFLNTLTPKLTLTAGTNGAETTGSLSSGVTANDVMVYLPTVTANQLIVTEEAS